MGNQKSIPAQFTPIQPQIITDSSNRESPPRKTHFFYIHPIPEQNDDFPDQENDDIPEIDEVKEEQIKQEIEEQTYINQQFSSQMHLIEQIKVKWNSFIKMKKTNFLKDYEVKKQLGRGGFGCVYKVRAIYTGIFRAAKKIKKTQLLAAEHEKLFAQMAIMKSLDHPNIAKLFEVYDYKDNYVLIMQLCEGGQLFKRITSRKITPETAINITRQVFCALVYMHHQGIVHRDLKPENMLFEKGTDVIKIIDFGIAVRKKPNQKLTTRLGTPYYIAPEVLCKSYDEKCDVWSMGVILFMMLFYRPPFTGQSEMEIMDSILKDEIVFRGKQWNSMTSNCKIFLASLLKKNPNDRPNALEAYQSSWLQVSNSKPITNQTLDITLNKIRKFGFRNKLEAVVYTYIVSQLLTNQEKFELSQIFKSLDEDNDGVISNAQFKKIIFQKLKNNSERLNTLMRMIDLDGSGSIDYTEFLVAALNPRQYLKLQHYERAFQYFDIDHSGEITYQEISQFLEESKESQESIKQIFKEVDENGDGTISKQQFVQLFVKQKLQKKHSKQNKKGIVQAEAQRERRIRQIFHKKEEDKKKKRKPKHSV